MTTQLQVVLTNNKLDPLETVDEQRVFTPFFEQVEQIKDTCNSIVITNVSEVELMQKARAYRLSLQKIRTTCEKEKNKLKEIPLRKTQAIDALFRYIKSEIEPLEAHLAAQEKFIEIENEKIKTELRNKRLEELSQYNADAAYIDLGDMPQINYDAFLENAKNVFAVKKEQEKQAEIVRLQEIEDQNAIRLENEKLKAAADKREQEIEAERKKVKAEQEAQLKKERDARLAIEAKIEAERVAIEKQNKEKAKLERAALLAPDREKLTTFAALLIGIEMPTVKDAKAQLLLQECARKISELATNLKEQSLLL